jgi:hypothetical protein
LPASGMPNRTIRTAAGSSVPAGAGGGVNADDMRTGPPGRYGSRSLTFSTRVANPSAWACSMNFRTSSLPIAELFK